MRSRWRSGLFVGRHPFRAVLFRALLLGAVSSLVGAAVRAQDTSSLNPANIDPPPYAEMTATAAPTATTDCTSSTQGDAGPKTGKDVKCRIEAVLAKHDTLLGKMKDRVGSCSGDDEKCAAMKKHFEKANAAQERAKRRNGRAKDSDFDDISSAKKGKCKGKDCTKGDDVVLTDDEETVSNDEVVEQLDEVSDAIDRTSALVDQAAADAPRLQALARAAKATPLGFAPLYDYTDSAMEPNYPAWLHVGDDPKAMIPATFAIMIAGSVADAVASTMAHVCGQDVLGFNASTVCIVFTALASALQSTAALMNFVMADAAGWDNHGAYMRAENIYDSLGYVSGNIDNVSTSVQQVGQAVGDVGTAVEETKDLVREVKGDLAEAKAQLTAQIAGVQQQVAANRSLLLQIIALLLTPEGRREVPASLLTCTGSNCPTVSIVCSGGVCSFNK